MKVLRLFLRCVLFCVLAAIALMAAWLVYIAHTRAPALDGVVTDPSLTGEVRVTRDDWGVPHIKAENEADAYFALGYAMAQDRLFQMEAVLRLARGELAEIAGPLAVPVDKIARSFRLREKAEAAINGKKAFSPGAVKAAEAFVAGVNHCVQTQPLPFEFAVLHIPPRTYTPADCLCVSAVLPISFAEGIRGDLLVTLMKERHPGMDIDALIPGYSKEVPVTIMESLDEAEAYLKAHPKSAPTPGKTAREPHPLNPAASQLMAAVEKLPQLFGSALGSNSWVLAPSKTQSGKPILANDPHIGFTNPGVWYEAHMQYGDFDLYGYYLPLIPFALLGNNRDFGWGLTMFENDDLDLYREKFKPDDPNKVMYKGEWVDVRTEEQTIKVRFGHDVKYTVRTTPHGPVMTDLFRIFDKYEGDDISLCWIWQHLDYTDADAFYRMGHARNCDEFGKAVALITSPGINVSYADREGNIAWWAAGVIPIRPKHVNPKQVLDGASGKDEFEGYVPFDQNPHLINPPCGYIVTANNKSTVKPVGPVEDLQGYWQPTDRAGRIKQVLESKEKWTIEELKAVQFDDRSYSAPAIVETLTGILRASEPSFSTLERQAFEALAHWDYRHNVDSIGASVYHVLSDEILEGALENKLGPVYLRDYFMLADHWNFYKYFVQDENSPYWDDITTPGKETRQMIVTKAFEKTVSILKKARGGNVAKWTWGSIHTLEFKHPFGYIPGLGRIFNIGPFPASGASHVINNMECLSGQPPYETVAGPSTRRLIDFADAEHSLTVLPTGNSGNFMSPHYGDQAVMFMAGKYREPRLTDKQISAHKAHEIIFKK